MHLFEVHERGRYTYVGEVEPAHEPYRADQQDVRSEDRYVWMFPLRKKQSAPITTPESPATKAPSYLPHGAYAVIGADLDEQQRALVTRAVDELKAAGISVFDERDRDYRWYEDALAAWHQAVLDRVRVRIKDLIAARKRAAQKANRELSLAMTN